MVKIERTPTPPPSLAIERQKAHGSYRERDVIEQLKADFHGKCYICELDNLTDIQVEHLHPHYNRKRLELVFDWNNLFYCCPHCNNIKKAPQYDDKIIDCCTVDPEQMLCHEFDGKAVFVKPAVSQDEARMTAELITNCFEQRNTGIREVQCEARFQRLADTMNALYVALGRYKENTTSQKYFRALRGMLMREYRFAAFTRYYVRTHLMDYPGLSDLVACQDRVDAVAALAKSAPDTLTLEQVGKE